MKMEIWCARSSDGMFRIAISDDEANVRFVEVRMTAENFANMLANQPVECDGEILNLNRVGKKQVREKRQVIINATEAHMDREKLRLKVKDLHKDDGWEMNDRLNSQGSVGFDHKKSEHIVNYTVEKWV